MEAEDEDDDDDKEEGEAVEVARGRGEVAAKKEDKEEAIGWVLLYFR
jgi:hypothetical protein